MRVVVLGAAVLAAGAYVLGSIHQWFSGRHYPYGVPKEILVAREVAARLEPGTIFVGDFADHYYQGKFSYLLLDDLQTDRVRPVAWLVYYPGLIPFEELRSDLRKAIPLLERTIWYIWTPLWDELPAIRKGREWSTVLFLSQIDSYGRDHLPVVRRLEQWKRLCPQGESVRFDDPRRDRRFELFRCPLPMAAAPPSSEAPPPAG